VKGLATLPTSSVVALANCPSRLSVDGPDNVLLDAADDGKSVSCSATSSSAVTGTSSPPQRYFTANT
jgi:hypothetical protein